MSWDYKTAETKDPAPGALQSTEQLISIGYEGHERGQKGVIRMGPSHWAPQCLMLRVLPSKNRRHFCGQSLKIW